MQTPSTPKGATRPDRSGPTPGQLAACGVLVVVPVLLALAVPLYQRTDPTLAGLPFFFWWQMLMAVVAAGACGATYLYLFRHEPEDDR